jgi:methyl-accepting chemotaxis protein
MVAFLFQPSMALMNRLRYAWKFLLIGVLVALPLGYVLYLQNDISTERIDFNEKERHGVAWVEPAREFLYQIERRRVAAVGVALGLSGFSGDVTSATDEANKAMKKVNEQDEEYGDELRTTKKWKQARTLWENLQKQKLSTADEADKYHADIASVMLDLILNQAGSNSNLVLDQELESYFLMDAYLRKMPALIDGIAKSATTGMRPQPDEQAEAEKNVELAGLYKQFLNTTTELDKTNFAGFRESAKKRGQNVAQLMKIAEKSLDKLNQHAELIRTKFLTAKEKPTQDQLRPIVTQTLEGSLQTLELWRRIGPQLDALVEDRVDSYSFNRNLALSIAIFAAFALLYLFIGFFISVQRSIAVLGDATNRMIAGALEEQIRLDAQDELGQIGTQYGQMNEALVEARMLKTRVEEENRQLQENIFDLLQTVSDAADGNLTVRARVTEGALGNVADGFNNLLESMQTLIGRVQSQLERSNRAVVEISELAKKMAAGATNQARDIMVARELVLRMSEENTRVSQDALTAASAAQRTEASAIEGAERVENVISTMNELRASVQAGAKRMKILGDRSLEITGIVATISRISEKTNLLALNAAIEAALAGEHGRGFHVVAEEVRKLAERTASATKEIDKLVKAIHAETKETAEAIERQTQVVEQESQLVAEAGVSLGKIRQVSTESAGLVAHISNVARAQVEGTQTMVRTMEEVTAIAQATQAGAEGTVATVGELISLSEQITQNIRQFKVA